MMNLPRLRQVTKETVNFGALPFLLNISKHDKRKKRRCKIYKE